MKKILLLIIILFIVTGCNKNDFTVTEFLDTADFNGYITSEDKKGYEDYDYIDNVYYAFNRDAEYFIQLLILNNGDYAKQFFLLNREDIAKLQDNNCYVKSKNYSNYNLYHLENDESYKLIIQAYNKIIYIDAPIGYINEIEEFLSELKLEY